MRDVENSFPLNNGKQLKIFEHLKYMEYGLNDDTIFWTKTKQLRNAGYYLHCYFYSEAYKAEDEHGKYIRYGTINIFPYGIFISCLLGTKEYLLSLADSYISVGVHPIDGLLELEPDFVLLNLNVIEKVLRHEPLSIEEIDGIILP